MKFLVDNQLPVALARFLESAALGSTHVLDLGMDEFTDTIIWNFSKAQGFILVSKDDDFLHLANRLDETGSLLWVRTGNCRKQFLLERFKMQVPRILKAFRDGYRIVEIR